MQQHLLLKALCSRLRICVSAFLCPISPGAGLRYHEVLAALVMGADIPTPMDSTAHPFADQSLECRDLTTLMRLDGQKVIKKPAALAKAIYPQVADYYATTPSLANVVGPALQKKRPCPKHLVEPIVAAISNENADVEPVELRQILAICRRFLLSSSERERPSLLSQAQGCSREFNQMISAIQTCQGLFTLTPPGVINDPYGHKVLDIVLSRAINEPKVRFDLCFAGTKRAIKFWSRIRTEIRMGSLLAGLGESQALIEKLRLSNAEGRLNVYSFPEAYCAFPCLTVDPESIERQLGFHVYFHVKPEISAIPTKDLGRWREFFYLQFRARKLGAVSVSMPEDADEVLGND